MTEKETIVAAAIMHDGEVWSLPAPARHNHICRKIYDANGVPCSPEAQGFLTSTGRFVNRWKAARIAIRAGQIEKIRGGHGLDELFSEDLW